MRTVFPLLILERGLRQMDELETTLGPMWFGAEWTEMKRRIKKLATECAQSGRVVANYTGLERHQV